jgi:hypothetical protein
MRRRIATAMLFILATHALSAQELPVGYNVAFIETNPPENTDALIRPNTDYVSVFLQSVFLNKREKFMTENDFAVDVALDVDGKPLSIPVYALRDRSVVGRLGIINHALLTSIPSSGKPVKVGIRVVRRTSGDPMRKAIDLLTSKETESLITTYAVNAVPFIGMIGSVANALYQSLGPPKDGDILFAVTPVAFSPTDGVATDRFTLRDTTMLLYKSNQILTEAKLSMSAGGTVMLDGRPLTGMPYVVIRLQKFTKRQDFTDRPWQRRYEQAVLAAASAGPSRDFSAADKLFSESLVLLNSDLDFTLADRNAISSANQRAYAKAKEQANAGAGTTVLAAIERAMVSPTELSGDTTAVTPGRITAVPLMFLPTRSPKVLSTQLLLTELEQLPTPQ